MWKSGAMLIHYKVYKFQAKVYEVGSEYGIDGEKISMAYIFRDGATVINYDRGWKLESMDKGAALALEILLK